MNLHAEIININGKDVIEYEDRDWRDKINKFKSKHSGKRILLSMEAMDTPERFLHKYYRGYLLPDVASAMGERDTGYVHTFVLKKMFLYEKANELKDVPARFRDRCSYFSEVKDGRDVLVGYVPSTGDITSKAMREFIQNVEQLLFVDLNGRINPEHQVQAKEMRDKGFPDVVKMVVDEFSGSIVEGETLPFGD